MKVAFLGLGVMGAPMAGHLVKAGHEVAVWNRTLSKASAWAKTHKGRVAPTVAGAAFGADVVFSCVGGDDDVRDLTVGGHRGFGALARGAVWVDHSTTSAEVAKELSTAARTWGVGYIDAPISGGESGAQAGTLTVMAGGDEEAWAKVEPVLAAYARKTVLVGASGAGQTAKMVNQICIAGVVQGLAEAMLFAERTGVEVPKIFEAISGGAARSWQLENRWATMLEGRYDFGFAIDWMRKDLGIVADEAKRLGVDLPITSLVAGFYDELSASGAGRQDTSALLERLRDVERMRATNTDR